MLRLMNIVSHSLPTNFNIVRKSAFITNRKKYFFTKVKQQPPNVHFHKRLFCTTSERNKEDILEETNLNQAIQDSTDIIEDDNNGNNNNTKMQPNIQPPTNGSGFTSLSDLYFTEGVESWQDLLTPYVLYPEHYASIVYYRDEHVVVIFDKYPKSKYHFLVMPAFELYGFEALTDEDVPILEELRDRGYKIADEIRTREPHLEFRLGFHAIPSLKQIHMHVISQDFQVPAMRSKKHWNAFTTDFFVDANLFITTLRTQGFIELDHSFYDGLLKGPLRCRKCKKEFKSMPKLKTHFLSCDPNNISLEEDES